MLVIGRRVHLQLYQSLTICYFMASTYFFLLHYAASNRIFLALLFRTVVVDVFVIIISIINFFGLTAPPNRLINEEC